MKAILITATNTDVGKTYTTLKLIPIFSKMGYKVGVMKPIETGVNDLPQDASLLLKKCKKYNKNFNSITVDDISPIQLKLPAAPIVANDFSPIDLSPALESFKKFKKSCDLLLIESAGGIFTPINLDLYMKDLADIFKAKTLLICDSHLGCISTTMLHISYMKSNNFDFIWAFNQRDENFPLVSKPFFQKKFQKTLTIQDDLEIIASNLLSL